MIPYIDIHTHQSQTNHKDLISIHSLLPHERDLNKNQFYSLGIHPWYIDHYSSWSEAKDFLRARSTSSEIIAFGECGLDRLQGPDLETQKSWLLEQLNFFVESRFKVCFIHCVRAWNDLLPLLKKTLSSPSTSEKYFILHDFNSSASEFQQMIEVENLYFSLGNNFLKPQSRLHRFLDQIPLTRLFFETDESDRKIGEVYEHYLSQFDQLDGKVLKERIFQNYKLLFS